MIKCVLLACLFLTLPTWGGQGLDWGSLAQHVGSFVKHARWTPQRPLQAQQADIALVGLGGFADEFSGIVSDIARHLPPLVEGTKEARAYYHWHADRTDALAVDIIAPDLRAFRRANPQAPLVLLGHSLGAALGLELAQQLSAGEGGPIYLLTLDPVAKGQNKARAASLTWWGNAYITHSQSDRDVIFQKAGRWGSCDGADCNFEYDGRTQNEDGRPFIHDDAWSLLCSREVEGGYSLCDWIFTLLQQAFTPAK